MARRIDKRNAARHAVDDNVVEAPDTGAQGEKDGQPIPKRDNVHKKPQKWYIREYIKNNIVFVFANKKINLNQESPHEGPCSCPSIKKDWICDLEDLVCPFFLP